MACCQTVTPRTADPQIRTALIDVAARLLVEEGPAALTTRRLATEVGTSTMAVYTHFAGMEQLRHELVAEGFRRLAARLDLVDLTDDPVADVAVMGVAYFTNAVSNPHLYRFMFSQQMAHKDAEISLGTFDRLVAGVERAIEAGRFKGEAAQLATQLWVMTHGIVTLDIAGVLPEEGLKIFADMGFNLFLSFGDRREAAERSVADAASRLPAAFFGPGVPRPAT